MADLVIATETFTANDTNGNPIVVHAGQTLLYDDDDLVRRFPHYFQVSERHQRPDVEQATSRPGEKRGQTARIKAEANPGTVETDTE